MTENLPETPETESNPPQDIPAKRKVPVKRFNIVRIEKRVTATFSIMAKVFVIMLISIAIIFIARQLADSGYSIAKKRHYPISGMF